MDCITGCGRPAFIKKTGECKRCYHRARRSGYYDNELAKQGKSRQQRKVKPARPEGRRLLKVVDLHRPIAYNTAHVRLKAWRGTAREYACVDCGGPAAQWSYSGSGRHEMRGTKTNQWGQVIEVSWSTEVADYSPRCIPCHNTHDLRTERCGCGHCSACKWRKRRAERRTRDQVA
ncbi:hypothetical protein ACWEOW_11200 [Monashia sp. NPDC004114]